MSTSSCIIATILILLTTAIDGFTQSITNQATDPEIREPVPGIFTAGNTSFKVTRYGLDDGLPLNAVNDIAQDTSGYLYLATNEGLVRYDGFNMTVFSTSNNASFPNNRISYLYYDSHGNLWLQFQNRLLARFDPSAERLISYHDLLGNVPRVRSGGDGSMWVMADQGVYRYDHGEETFYKLNLPEGVGIIQGISPISQREIYLAATSGFWHKKDGTYRFLGNLPDHLQTFRLFEMTAFPRNGHLWISTSRNYFLFKLPDMQEVINLPDMDGVDKVVDYLAESNEYLLMLDDGYDFVNAATLEQKRIAVQIDHLIWTRRHLTTRNNAFVHLGNDAVYIGDTEISGLRHPSGIFEDQEGIIWVMSQSHGLYKIEQVYLENITDLGGHPISNVYSIFESAFRPGEYWAASYIRGVFRWNDSQVTVWNQANNKLRTGFVWFVGEDGYGRIYASEFGQGLHRLNKQEEWVPMSEQSNGILNDQVTVNALYHDIKPDGRQQTDRLIFGTNVGLVVQDSTGWYTINTIDNSGIPQVRSFARLPSGELLAGTAGGGLLALDEDLNLTWKLTQQDGLGSDYIRDIFTQSADTLWVVTESMGLNRIVLRGNKPAEIRQVTVQQGLLHNGTHRMIADGQGRIWISSNMGIMLTNLYHLNLTADHPDIPLVMVVINESAGMINREANGGVENAGIFTSSGDLLIPNQRGITRIDPDQFYEALDFTVPVPVIEKLELPDKRNVFPVNNQLKLPLGERTFNIRFAVPKHRNSHTLQIAYMMSGVDTRWQQVEDYFIARYTDLRPGRYRFQLRAVQADGSLRTSYLYLDVPHFFYETRWFSGLMMIFAAVVVFGIIRYREEQQLRFGHIQELVDRQTLQLQRYSEQRDRFYAGITHDLRQPLTLIMGPLELLLNTNRLKSDEWVRHYLTMINRNARRMENLMNQMEEVTHLEGSETPFRLKPFDLQQFTRQIIGHILDQPGYTNFPIHLEINADSLYALIERDAWERVVINLIENAWQHAYSTKGFQISFRRHTGHAEVCFRDFGQGINPDLIPRLFDYKSKGSDSQGSGIGLYLVRELVHRMKGTIRVESTGHEGTVLVVRLRAANTQLQAAVSVAVQPDLPAETETHNLNTLMNHADRPKVMIVDDNEEYAAYMVEQLRTDYQLLSCSSSMAATQMVTEFKPDLVLSDVNMDGMDGYTLVRTIRSMDQFRTLPVIFLSGNAHDSFVQKGLSSGADVYLTKPVSTEVVRTQIQVLFQREERLRNADVLVHEAEKEHELVRQVTELIYRHIGNTQLSPEMLADALHTSRATLYRDWKKVMPATLKKFILKIRLQEARKLIEQEGYTVKMAAISVGIRDAGYFAGLFRKEFKQAPSELKKIGT